MFKIVPISAFSDNYIWLLYDQVSRRSVVVDPGDATPVLNYLQNNGLTLTAILLTHHHNDHVGGVMELLKNYDVPVFGPAYNQLSFVSHPLGHNQQIVLESLDQVFNIIAVPGHTLDHIVYYDNQHLFCGDTLFLGGCGRLFEGTAEQMLHSLDILAQLPEDLLIYCAHEYTLQNLKFAETLDPHNAELLLRIENTIQQRLQQQITIPGRLSVEKRTNPFLRVHNDQFKQQCEAKWQKTFANATELFTAIRAAKDKFCFSETNYLTTAGNIAQ